MKYFVVLWIEFDLGWISKRLPQHLHPILGQAVPKSEIYTKREHAFSKVKDLGPFAAPRIFWCENLKWHEKDVTHQTVTTIEGE